MNKLGYDKSRSIHPDTKDPIAAFKKDDNKQLILAQQDQETHEKKSTRAKRSTRKAAALLNYDTEIEEIPTNVYKKTKEEGKKKTAKKQTYSSPYYYTSPAAGTFKYDNTGDLSSLSTEGSASSKGKIQFSMFT